MLGFTIHRNAVVPRLVFIYRYGAASGIVRAGGVGYGHILGFMAIVKVFVITGQLSYAALNVPLRIKARIDGKQFLHQLRTVPVFFMKIDQLALIDASPIGCGFAGMVA